MKVVEIVRERPPSLDQAAAMVLASPKASENVLKGLAAAAEAGKIPDHSRERLASAAHHAATWLGTAQPRLFR